MAPLFLLAFILMPIVEIGVFIEVGGWIGLWATLAIVIATAVAGTWLLRLQGMATLARGRAALEKHVFPADALFDGLCLIFAGALLLTPGFVTDTVGLLLFLPPVRRWLHRLARRHLIRTGAAWTWQTGPDGDIIEADYYEVRPDGDGRDARATDDPRQIEDDRPRG